MRRKTLLAILWTLLILVVCWTPPRRLPIEEGQPSLLRRFHFDKVAHCAMFIGFAFLWRRSTDRATTSIVAASGVALAVITELGQGTALVGRDADLWDGLADCLGVGIGLISAAAISGQPRTAGPSLTTPEPV